MSEQVINSLGYSKFSEGVFPYSNTIILPQQRTDLRVVSSNPNFVHLKGVPPAYNQSGRFSPMGWLEGQGWSSTTLLFDNTVTGSLIKSQYLGTSDYGTRGMVGGGIRNLAINGSAQIRPEPWDYFPWSPHPDPNGPDLIRRANGISIEGSGFLGEFIHLFDIPGTGIVLVTASQVSSYDQFNLLNHYLDYINIQSAYIGINASGAGDSKFDHIEIQNIVTDCFIAGEATVLNNSHFFGADRGFVSAKPCSGTSCYHEACRIGTHLYDAAHSSVFTNLKIGPTTGGTCWYRGLLLDGVNGCRFTNLYGAVRAQDADHPDTAGFEIKYADQSHTYITGSPVTYGTSPCGIIRGIRGYFSLQGGIFDATSESSYLKIGSTRQSHVEVRGTSVNGLGHLLDFTSSDLNNNNGQGNVFLVWTDMPNPIKYQDGSHTNNLASGNEVRINNVPQ